MFLEDNKLDKVLAEVMRDFSPVSIDRMRSHLVSVHRQVEDLRISRDNWRNKYEELKKSGEAKRM